MTDRNARQALLLPLRFLLPVVGDDKQTFATEFFRSFGKDIELAFAGNEMIFFITRCLLPQKNSFLFNKIIVLNKIVCFLFNRHP